MFALLFGIIHALLVVVAIIIGALTLKWIIGYIKKKYKEKKEHEKIVFADTEEVINDYLKEKIKETEPISMEELEKMCEDKPYVAAYYDEETDELRDVEAFKPEDIDTKAKQYMEDSDGIIVVD